MPANFVVNSTADTGVGTLRNQIAAANAAAGADTISFDATVFVSPQTITLKTGEIAITSDLTIDGPAAALTISGNSSSRIFNINGAGTLVVGIQDLTLTKALTAGSNDGGAIFIQDENVTITNCTLTANSSADAGGAIRQEAGGSLTLSNCTFTSNTATSSGGALSLAGAPTLSISDSTFASNFAVSGGAVNMFQGGSLTVTGSTFNFNQATASLGGAIFLNGSFTSAFVRNTTIHSNLADTSGGGIAFSSSSAGTLAIQNSTITGNGASGGDGGGIARTGGTALITTTSSIIFGNTASTTADDIFTGGQVTATRSLIGTKVGITTYSADAFTTLNLGANPNLGNLQNNDGPTQTRMPNAGSIAIDNGSNPAALPTDQRGPGYLRQRGPAVDIGAVEVPADFVVTNSNNSGAGSLRQAILDANSAIGIDTITFDPTFFSTARTISMSTGEMVISEGLTIDGPASELNINANNSSRIFRIEGTGPVPATLRDMRLNNGKVTGANDGGAILVAGAGGVQTFTNLDFFSNDSADQGGAIHFAASGTSATIENCDFQANSAVTGGALSFVSGVAVALRNSVFRGNSASGSGGGVAVLGTSPFSFTNTTLSANTAATGGGVAWLVSANNNSINNSTLTGNTATGGKGGGAYAAAGTLNLASTIASGNIGGNGPDIFNPATTAVNFSAIGSATGFTLTGANNLPFGTDLKLGPLQNNGFGTFGISHAPALDSPVLNKGSNTTGASFDQRNTGFPRQRGSGVDIGAVEVDLFIVTNTNASGAGSLSQAVLDANAAAGTDTIRFDPTVFATTKTIIPSAELTVTSDLNIEGPPEQVIVSGNLAHRILQATGGDTFNFSNLRFTLGSAASSGGAIVINSGIGSTATFQDCIFLFNQSSNSGGALSGISATINLVDCALNNNTATQGGAIVISGGEFFLTRTTVSNNDSTAAIGGGIAFFSTGGTLSIVDSTISGNETKNAGGGIAFFNSSGTAGFVLRNSTISNNTATAEGGGIFWGSSAGVSTIQNCTITGNSSGIAAGGGGISVDTGTGNLSIESSIISGNVNAGAPDIDNPNTTSVGTSAIGDNLGFAKTDLGGNLPFQPHANLKLGVLANNGGPTLTHLPQAGSPLINVGSNPASLATDQRGFPRSLSGAPDIGSAEFLNTVVKNTNDSGVDSLRQIILDTNATPGSQTITFDSTVFATAKTITLTSGVLAVTDDVTITGPSIGVAISGNKASRVMDIGSTNSLTVSLANLTIRDGVAGVGVLYGAGIVTSDDVIVLANCTFVDNSALSGAGGISVAAIALPFASLTVNNSSFINNIGRGLEIGANTIELKVNGSTFTGNSTFDRGGAILAVNQGSVSISNSTISGNSADEGGGIFLLHGAVLTIQNSTIVNNTSATSGGGIARTSSVATTIASSIVSGNSAPSGPDMSLAGSVSVTTSLIGSTAGATTFSGDTFTNANIGVDPQLGPLADKGGPTLTHLPAAASPARNNGSNPAGLTTDQRGLARVSGAAIDIGAVELQEFVVTNTNNSGAGSLRQAIINANATAGSVVTFDPTVFAAGKSIALSTGELAITQSMTILGPAAEVSVSGANASRIFNINGAGTLTVAISNVNMGFGKATGTNEGGSVFVQDENVTFTNCDIFDSTASSGGGGVHLEGAGSLTFEFCNITNNQSGSSGGGGIDSDLNGTIVVKNSTINLNTAAAGAAINLLGGGSLTVLDSTLSANTATSGGGGGIVVNSSGTVTIRNSTLSGNSASGSGGAVSNAAGSTGTILIQNTTITNNSAGASGGGVSRSGLNGPLTLESSIVSGNVAVSNADINGGTVSVNFSAIGSASGFTLSGSSGNNLAFGLNLKLGALANNGGPTLSHLPAVGSPLVNVGSNPAALAHDQRGPGFARVLGGAIDIGAVEVLDTVVRNTNDAGPGSLRQVILDTNALPGADTITFDSTVFSTAKTITLATGQLHIADDLTISAPIVGVTVNAQNLSRVILVSNGEFNNVVVNAAFLRLTITGGNPTDDDGGGGILNRFESITLTDCIVTGNTVSVNGFGGAGIQSLGDALLTNTVISNNSCANNGGGLANQTLGADIQLVNCAITNNTATSGGGLSTGNGTLTILGTTISGNTANSTNSFGGGGISTAGDIVVIRNSTISNNVSISHGGAIMLFTSSGDPTTIQNSTITGNSAGSGKEGGAIFCTPSSDGPVTITSSILHGNTASIGPEISTPGTVSVTVNTSLIGSKAGVAAYSGDNFTNANIGVNPLLGPLANNGGPTLTHMPAVASLAVNNGSNPAGLTADQRGFTRVVGGAIDIGAVETRSFLVTNTNDSGAGSLRQAMLDTNSFAGADIIAFDSIVFSSTKTISALSALPSIADAVSIVGPGTDLLTVRRDPGAAAFGVFGISPSAFTVAISDLTISGGSNTGGGGISIATSALSLDRVSISGNTATNSGGAILASGGTPLTIRDSSIAGNRALAIGSGGGLSLLNSTALIERSTISGNKGGSNGSGAGLINGTGSFSLLSSTVSNNFGSSGAFEFNAFTGTATIRNSTITANSAPSFANGGIFIRLGSPTIEFRSSVLAGNLLNGANEDFGITTGTSVALSLGTSLIGKSSSSFAFTDLGGNLPFGLDPRLGPLVDNGGPTLTHLPLSTSPLIGAGSNPDSLTIDQRGLTRVIGDIDIGATEFNGIGFTVNGGANQRSRITTMKVNFTAPVDATTLTGLGAITLTRTAATGLGTVGTVVQTGAAGANGRILVSPANGLTFGVTLTFDNADGSPYSAGVEGTSLADGRWQLAIPSLGFSSTLNDAYLRRLFGDSDNNGTVDGAVDFPAFGAQFNLTGANLAFDFNNDGTVDGAVDFPAFGANFNTTL